MASRVLGRLACLWFVLGAYPQLAGAAEAVRLTHWEDPAALIRSSGPGTDYYELVAAVERERKLSGRFAIADFPRTLRPVQ